MSFLFAFVATALGLFLLVPTFFAGLRLIGVYVIVPERTARVYVLFGNVVTTLSEPGIHFLWAKMGVRALIINWLGTCHVVDLSLRQEYLRSQAVNSEEGAPLGIGVWYEMVVSDPVAYLFRNADPQGSLRANVGNATVRCLSNMRLAEMLENRHTMSHSVRRDVSEKSNEWGYGIGSVYVRKVHFRDAGMIRQIEEKVVNRLRQVTSAIMQDGTNRVNIIASTADREAAVEVAKARTLPLAIIGKALASIMQEPEVAEAMFSIMETQNLLQGEGRVIMVPPHSGSTLTSLLAFNETNRTVAAKPVQ
jgi:regulator of protease activity HflC (stomatin/prohibitin superfamily)